MPDESQKLRMADSSLIGVESGGGNSLCVGKRKEEMNHDEES